MPKIQIALEWNSHHWMIKIASLNLIFLLSTRVKCNDFQPEFLILFHECSVWCSENLYVSANVFEIESTKLVCIERHFDVNIGIVTIPCQTKI